jgi:hypothetical protein
MTQVKVQLSDAMETSLIMLYGLAMDAHAEPTILGDTVAARAFDGALGGAQSSCPDKTP